MSLAHPILKHIGAEAKEATEDIEEHGETGAEAIEEIAEKAAEDIERTS